MLESSSRLLHSSQSVLATLNPSSSSRSTAKLPPVRYHIFRTPLPYPIGLKLQNDIIESRLAAREKDASRGKQDVLLLLGMPLPLD